MPFDPSEFETLNASGILQDIPDDVVLEAIDGSPDRQCSQLCLPSDAIFLCAGQSTPGLYIIIHGTIEMFVAEADGKERVLDFVKGGSTLAKETLFSDKPLQYSARSLSAAAVLHLPNALISEWIARYPAFARRLMSLVAERIDFLYKDMLTFRSKRATSRLVCYLLCHFDKAPRTPDGSYTLRIDIPHNKLASRLGVSDSQISRSFRELQEQGLIVAQDQGFFIPNVPALSKYVCPAGCDF